ncbi:uncharacterized protein [Choristoneura fumiferana]|uniref:uncharacterized protein n=1 Tax=Choristoneura fumiferana TaxID=7141 RepID=UPI003D1577DE
MATHEDELKDLKEKNNELVQKVQYWKMTAAQRENEKLELMKEINELRLKVIRLKSGGAAEARKLDAAIQSASEEALSHLVQASSAVARTIELTKTYMRDRQDLETLSPRWSNISNTTEKVHRVPPMMGGQSIQPVVSLSRTLNLSGQRASARSPNSARNVTVRAVPMHMLQDVYIPLTRIDTRLIPNNNDTEQLEVVADNVEENIPFDTSMEEAADESQNITDEDGYETSRRLDIVEEDAEEDVVLTPPRARVENPLEGPSWLLDALGTQREATESRRRPNLEPDSTTQGEEAGTPPMDPPRESPELESPVEPARMFTPTVRRRRRVSPPRPSPANDTLRQLQSERVLQVLVPKMRLESDASPPKRVMRFDAPSPNGATDSRVIVSEEVARATNSRPSCDEGHKPPGTSDPRARGDNSDNNDITDNRDITQASQESHRRESGDSDSSGTGRVSEGRTRRNRKPVTYKEKPLNRKLRR